RTRRITAAREVADGNAPANPQTRIIGYGRCNRQRKHCRGGSDNGTPRPMDGLHAPLPRRRAPNPTIILALKMLGWVVSFFWLPGSCAIRRASDAFPPSKRRIAVDVLGVMTR